MQTKHTTMLILTNTNVSKLFWKQETVVGSRYLGISVKTCTCTTLEKTKDMELQANLT